MWIKTPDATLLNLNNGNEIKVEGKFVMLYLASRALKDFYLKLEESSYRGEKIKLCCVEEADYNYNSKYIGEFDTFEEADAYFDKLAETLEAVEI